MRLPKQLTVTLSQGTHQPPPGSLLVKRLRKGKDMKSSSISIMAALAMTVGAATAFAQSPAGSPADPNSVQNRQPGPSAITPTDPAAGSNPSARIPSAPLGESAPLDEDAPASDGASSGEMGSADAPAGSPADPNSNENRQPGPSAITPTDPAAGANPSARVPTAPSE